MAQDNTVDLGVVQVHKKVIGDIAAAPSRTLRASRLPPSASSVQSRKPLVIRIIPRSA